MIIGNAPVVTRLQRCLEAARLHAVILAGPRSVGKTTLACAIAAQRLGRPLGILDPDVQLVEPIDGKKIGIAAVHEVLRSARRQAVFGRTIIITDADRLTPEAGNALLVFLENPPERTLSILTTTSYAAVLPTIRSRCAPFILGPVPAATLRQGLIDRGFTDPTLLEEAIRLSRGLPGLALRFLQDPAERVTLRGLLQLAEQWNAADTIGRMRLAATIGEDGRARKLLELLGSASGTSVAQKPAVLLALHRLDRNVTARAVLEAFAMLPT